MRRPYTANDVTHFIQHSYRAAHTTEHERTPASAHTHHGTTAQNRPSRPPPPLPPNPGASKAPTPPQIPGSTPPSSQVTEDFAAAWSFSLLWWLGSVLLGLFAAIPFILLALARAIYYCISLFLQLLSMCWRWIRRACKNWPCPAKIIAMLVILILFLAFLFRWKPTSLPTSNVDDRSSTNRTKQHNVSTITRDEELLLDLFQHLVDITDDIPHATANMKGIWDGMGVAASMVSYFDNEGFRFFKASELQHGARTVLEAVQTVNVESIGLPEYMRGFVERNGAIVDSIASGILSPPTEFPGWLLYRLGLREAEAFLDTDTEADLRTWLEHYPGDLAELYAYLKHIYVLLQASRNDWIHFNATVNAAYQEQRATCCPADAPSTPQSWLQWLLLLHSPERCIDTDSRCASQLIQQNTLHVLKCAVLGIQAQIGVTVRIMQGTAAEMTKLKGAEGQVQAVRREAESRSVPKVETWKKMQKTVKALKKSRWSAAKVLDAGNGVIVVVQPPPPPPPAAAAAAAAAAIARGRRARHGVGGDDETVDEEDDAEE